MIDTAHQFQNHWVYDHECYIALCENQMDFQDKLNMDWIADQIINHFSEKYPGLRFSVIEVDCMCPSIDTHINDDDYESDQLDDEVEEFFNNLSREDMFFL